MQLVCVLLCLMLGTSAAAPQDLSGKRFTFPLETDTDHVSVKLNRTELGALSVCMRVFSDLLRPHGLFLLTAHYSNHTKNNFLITNHSDSAQYSFHYSYGTPFFNHQGNYIINMWQIVCSTWDATTGLAQLWIDGKYLSRKFLSDITMTGPMSVILGQSSDPANREPPPFGRKNRDTSFVGMLSDLHVWDYVLDPLEVRNYGRFTSSAGNVLNWRQLDFEIHGRILLE